MGAGRTDLICALWLARSWLEDTPRGVDREIYVLTDGDLPHSGRFVDCRRAQRRGGRDAVQACESRRNPTRCPVAMRYVVGRSDLAQLDVFAAHAGRELSVTPLVFEPDRAARAYHELADKTGGRLVRVASVQGIDALLPALLARQVQGVFATNVTTGRRTGDLLGADRRHFAGELELRPGPNDVELRVESERGTAALFRFRIYAAAEFPERFLTNLRRRNRDLELRFDDLLAEARARRGGPRGRRLEIRPEGAGD